MFGEAIFVFALTMQVIVQSKQYEMKEFENPTVSLLFNSNITSV